MHPKHLFPICSVLFGIAGGSLSAFAQNTEQEQNPNLPDEVILEILKNSDVSSWISFSQTSTKWQSEVQEKLKDLQPILKLIREIQNNPDLNSPVIRTKLSQIRMKWDELELHHKDDSKWVHSQAEYILPNMQTILSRLFLESQMRRSGSEFNKNEPVLALSEIAQNQFLSRNWIHQILELTESMDCYDKFEILPFLAIHPEANDEIWNSLNHQLKQTLKQSNSQTLSVCNTLVTYTLEGILAHPEKTNSILNQIQTDFSQFAKSSDEGPGHSSDTGLKNFKLDLQKRILIVRLIKSRYSSKK
jgi:hypothetical protein